MMLGKRFSWHLLFEKKVLAFQGETKIKKSPKTKKYWFSNENKTGCRYLLVDAYNDGEGTEFYSKNGFSFLTRDDEVDDTRIMFFDLITYRE